MSVSDCNYALRHTWEETQQPLTRCVKPHFLSALRAKSLGDVLIKTQQTEGQALHHERQPEACPHCGAHDWQLGALRWRCGQCHFLEGISTEDGVCQNITRHLVP